MRDATNNELTKEEIKIWQDYTFGLWLPEVKSDREMLDIFKV
jgi:hypothetical protein